MEMPIKFKVKANKVGNSLKITLPVEVAEYLQLTAGDTVEMWGEGNDKVILEKKK
jgi:antitoxin component of MazEF toxin-antitoxin module